MRCLLLSLLLAITALAGPVPLKVDNQTGDIYPPPGQVVNLPAGSTMGNVPIATGTGAVITISDDGSVTATNISTIDFGSVLDINIAGSEADVTLTISEASAATPTLTDTFLLGDASDSGLIKRATLSELRTLIDTGGNSLIVIKEDGGLTTTKATTINLGTGLDWTWADPEATLDLDINEYGSATPTLVDTILIYDDSAAAVKKSSLVNVQALIDTNTTYTAGAGLTLAGTVFSLDHLGFQDMTDPNGDRITYWDDTAGNMDWLFVGSTLQIVGSILNVAADSIGNTKLAEMAQSTLKGRQSGAGTGDPQDLTAAQVRTILNVENGATSDQTDSEIETAYNNQVAQVSTAERTAGTETAIRRLSPADIHSMIDTHGAGGGAGGSGTVNRVKDDGLQVGEADIVTIDVGLGLKATESPDKEINLDLDIAELPLTSLNTLDSLVFMDASDSNLPKRNTLYALKLMIDTDTDTDTQLTEEQVEDFIGNGLTGNTETGITVTYQDADGTFDFVVDSITAADLGAASENIEADGTIRWEDAGALDSSGNLTTTYLVATDIDTESEFETLLTNVTNVFTNNDISSFGASLVDDADQASAQTTLNVDPAGTDNSTNVTLAGTPDYVTLSGQVLTRGLVDVTTDITGVVPISNLATGTPNGSKFIRDDGVLAEIAGGGDALVANPLSQFATTTSLQLAGVISDETGTGAVVLSTSPTLVTPALGTPSAAILTNATGYPGDESLLTTGTIGTGTWQGTAIADPYIASAATWNGKQDQANVLDDITATGTATAADQIIVSTGAGTFSLESGSTLLASIGADPAGTDNSTNVTLAGTPDYVTLSGQVLTRGLVDVTTDITGVVPIANLGTGTPDGTKYLRDDGVFANPGINHLSDVSISDPSENDILVYDTGSWVNVESVPSADRTQFKIRNETGSTISAGTPVYISGFSGGQDVPLAAAADASSAITMPAIGVLKEDLSNNSTGYCVSLGSVVNIDTSTFSAGDTLYVANGGGFTKTKPTGTNLIQNIGKCLKVNTTTGSIEVMGAGRSNDVPNITSANFWVGNASSVATPVVMSGDATMTNAGVVSLAGNSVSDAEIALVTPALGTPSSVVLTNATGYPGDASLVTTGTIGTGTWQGTAIADAYISGAAGWDAKQAQADILDDIGAVSAPGAADQVLVSTGAGAFALESGATLRTSLGLAIGFDVQPYNPIVADSQDTLGYFSSTTSAELAGVISDETGTGAAVFGTSPTLVTPALGTPSSVVLTNATGLPVAGLAASTSADLAGVISDETGTGAAVFGTSPTLVTPALGTPSAVVLTNATGYPGDSSLVTVGTVATGTWQGTRVDSDYLDLSVKLLGQWYDMMADAAAWKPDSTTGPETGDSDEHTIKAFSGIASETARIKPMMPRSWNEGTVKVTVAWKGTTGAAPGDGVAFVISGASVANDGAWPPTTGSAVTFTDTVIAVGDMHYVTSGSITVAGAAAGVLTEFELYRDHDHGSDTMTEDLHLYSVLLHYQKASTEVAAP